MKKFGKEKIDSLTDFVTVVVTKREYVYGSSVHVWEVMDNNVGNNVKMIVFTVIKRVESV